MHMIDVMNKLKEIAESGYDNEDIQRGIDAAATQKFDEAEVAEEDAVEEDAVEEDAVEEDAVEEAIEDGKTYAWINVETGDYGYGTKEESSNWTHYIPMSDFSYFSDDEDYKNYPEEVAKQEGWIAVEESVEEANGRSELQAAYGAVYEYVGELDDEALEYVDRYAPDFSNAMDQYGGIADIEANSTPEQIQHYISELKDAESALAEITSESVEEVHEDVEEDTSLADMLRLAGRSGVMGLSQNNIIAESLELDEEDEVEVSEDTQENEVKRVIAKILGRYRPLTYDDFDNEDLNSALYDFFSNSGEIPYDVATSGDPNEWIFDKLNSLGMTEDLQEGPVSALSELMRLAGYEDYEAKINEYENDPEVEYMDVEDQMIGLSGGLNGPKKAYAAAAGGDNAMAQEPTEVDESLEESFYKEYSKMVEELKDAD